MSATSLAHAVVDDLVRQATELSAKGDNQKAFELLSAQEVQRAGDFDFDLALGVAGTGAGEFPRAIMALERALSAQPENPVARATMGRALYGVGDTRGAKAFLTESQKAGVAAVAGETIDQLLHAIDRVDAAGKSSWRGYVEFGVSDDSNINGAPGVSNVAVPAYGGSILAISPSGSRQKGTSAWLGGGLSGRYVIDPRWSLIGAVSVANRGYDARNTANDTMQLDANGGISYRNDERSEYSLLVQVGTYDTDGQRTRDLSGFTGEWTYRFDGFRQLNTYVQLSRLTYPSSTISNADRHVYGVSYAQMFTGGFWAYGGAYVGEEAERAAGVAYLGHKLWGIRLGAQAPINSEASVFVAGGYEDRRFGGTDPLFLVGRHDQQTNISVGISWVPGAFWRITPQVSQTRTRSNVPLADFDKRVVSVAVRRDF